LRSKNKSKRIQAAKKANHISVKWKIFLFLLGFCGVLLVLLWLSQVVFLDNFYKSIKVNEIKTAASTIEKNIDSESISSIVSSISVNNDICIEVLSSTGEVLYSSHVLKDCVIHNNSRFSDENPGSSGIDKNDGETYQYYKHNETDNTTVVPDAAAGTTDGSAATTDPATTTPDSTLKPDQKEPIPDKIAREKENIIYTKSIKDANNNDVTLVLNSVVSPVNATVNTLRVQLYYITAFMILFSVILALIIAKWISKPIEAINDSAKILATGDYNTRFEGRGYREIAELSNTLNYTAKELSKVEGLRKELIANISHDLRTPLTLISGYAEAMRDLPDENNSENAQIIVDETKRLTTLVNDVMDISKLQSGSCNIEPQCYDLTSSISETVNRMNKLMEKDGYTISFKSDQNVNVIADETRISQVFYNLLINAINYTGSDKKVFVTQRIYNNPEDSDSEWVKIEVADTGEGISEEDLSYIWERYYKVDKTHKRAVTGTGLGLSIVRNIISMHQGDCGVTSKINEGSVFWFSLKI
jgi:Signal transduction histidine kinase